ncbi:MAG: response regulator, partial [Deltaproteobacteria bacterium]|nr:response regulator [Deltaproteobacteria bacterium]
MHDGNIPNDPDLECRTLHAVLEGCPVGAAIVAHGRLCFANTLFVENTRLAAGAEGLRVVFDDAASGARHLELSNKNAMLFWDVSEGNEHRMRLIARTAPYKGGDAFFLWLTGLADDTMLQAAQYVQASVPPAPEPAPAAPLPSVEHAAPPVKSKARVLLAEDNEINQEIAIELLEHADVEVEVASNGQEAVDLFQQKDFDLILMDIQMPVMDGAEATRLIRASSKAGADTVPILAMTAHAMESDREKSLNVGMNDHLTKPIDPRLLYAALDTWLPKREPAAQAPGAPELAPAPPGTASAPPPDTGGQPSPAPVAAPTEAQQDILFSLKVIDAQAGLSNVAGNRELYLRLLDRFAKNYRNSGAELRDALQRMERDASAHEEAVRLAHTAKGVAANLGARALAAIAGELESAIKKHDIQAEMHARYDALLREAL